MQTFDHESRINTALGKILRSFNFLELNLGLCIRFFENPRKVDRSHAWLAKSSIQEKIDRFASIVLESNLVTDTTKLDAWLELVVDAKQLRNFYAHGTWEYLPLRTDAPLQFGLPPWRSEDERVQSALPMTIEELESHADLVEKALVQFLALRREYGV